MSNFKNILDYIPGFESKVRWKMAVALVYYVFCLFMIKKGWACFLFFLGSPFMVFYSRNAFRQRTIKSIILCSIALVITCVGAGNIF